MEAEILHSLGKREGLEVERVSESIDYIQFKREREEKALTLHRESNRLVSVRLALARIAGQTYGICEHCEKEIGPKRLAALPWARNCLHCQERIDAAKSGELEAALVN